jgi:hypothetical protein
MDGDLWLKERRRVIARGVGEGGRFQPIFYDSPAASQPQSLTNQQGMNLSKRGPCTICGKRDDSMFVSAPDESMLCNSCVSNQLEGTWKP